MERVLGLDLGTNSIGWAVVDRVDGSTSLVDKGVCIFQEGVAREKGNEKPAVQERTMARASRRHYFRRRLRKIELLRVLVKNDLCPYLPEEAFSEWKLKKKYPMDSSFLAWQRTDDNIEKNPYHDRYRCLTESLDFTLREDRYCLGRALYHINQRRGFLSGRKDSASSDDGKVKTGISELSTLMKEAGCKYLGEYFYVLYQSGQKIRCRYTSRDAHYRSEFDAICKRQGVSDELKKSLERAIFFQRPLKSQKGTVGHCTFEPTKPRCPLSHPAYEEFRMLQFINSVKVRSYADEEFRQLNAGEVASVIPLFFRKSAVTFNFEDIAKRIAGKGNYSWKEDKVSKPYIFNYRMDASVSGCPVSAAIASSINDRSDYSTWVDDLCALYVKGDGKEKMQILNDVWHALFSFDDEAMLQRWLMDNLQLSEEKAHQLAKAKIPQGYSALSLKAINKILPYLRGGFRYDESVFLANLKTAFPKGVTDALSTKIEDDVIRVMRDFDINPQIDKHATKYSRVAECLSENGCFNIERLYHPSMIETYETALPGRDGKRRLGSPRTDSFRNPMVMRALFRMRDLVNELIDNGTIDSHTKVNIEFARGLNDANRRKAIEDYQRDNEKKHKEARERISELYHEATGIEIVPTDDDVLKYQLWQEQGNICLYTGRVISITDFIGPSASYDIEHTVPRSRGGDDSQMNKTLCQNKYNRDVKKACIPSELADYDEIMIRVNSLGWHDQIESFTRQINACTRNAKSAETKDAKDNAIRRRHYLEMQRDYLKGKLMRFTMSEVPDGFSNRQGVDIGIINRYGRMYLKTVFDKVYVVKGATTAEFRKMWGLQSEYAKKERVNHSHHCIDAITIACIGKAEYDEWARYKTAEEGYKMGRQSRPVFPKPWATFTEDVRGITDNLIVVHHTVDNMPKQTRKIVKVRGKIKRNAAGQPLYAQGDTARGSLHLQTYYGAIRRDDVVRYVIRKSLDSLDAKDIKNIVDDVVRKKVEDASNAHGSLKNAVAAGIWMNEEKRIPINKVRLYTGITSPISLKKHRDKSEKEYKRDYHVSSESNYCMGIYEDNGKRSFQLISMYDAARYYNGKTGSGRSLLKTDDGRTLKYMLKSGDMVLLFEKSKEEISNLSVAQLSKRMYKVIGLSHSTVKTGGREYDYGMITMRFHQEARPGTEVPSKKGVWRDKEEYRPTITLSHSQFNGLIAGIDFEITVTGQIHQNK